MVLAPISKMNAFFQIRSRNNLCSLSLKTLKRWKKPLFRLSRWTMGIIMREKKSSLFSNKNKRIWKLWWRGRFRRSEGGKKVYKISLYIFDPQTADTLLALFQAKWPALNVSKTSIDYIEITNQGADKRKAFDALKKKYDDRSGKRRIYWRWKQRSSFVWRAPPYVWHASYTKWSKKHVNKIVTSIEEAIKIEEGRIWLCQENESRTSGDRCFDGLGNFKKRKAFDAKSAIPVSAFKDLPLATKTLAYTIANLVEEGVVVQTDGDLYYYDELGFKALEVKFVKGYSMFIVIPIVLLVIVLLVQHFFIFRSMMWHSTSFFCVRVLHWKKKERRLCQLKRPTRMQKQEKREKEEAEGKGLPVLDQILQDPSEYAKERIGIREIPLEQIVGTKTEGRKGAMTGQFYLF